MCDYCCDADTSKYTDFAGSEGIYYEIYDGEYYLVIEHYRNERNKVIIKYCPWCGRKLDGN